MSQCATKQEVQEIVDTAVDRAVVDLSEIITQFAQQADKRFNKLEADVADLRSSHERLLDFIDGLVRRWPARTAPSFGRMV